MAGNRSARIGLCEREFRKSARVPEMPPLKQKQGYCDVPDFRDVGIFLVKMPASIDLLP